MTAQPQQFDEAPALEAPPLWQWPRQAPAPDVQRIADVAMICSLEQAPRELQLEFQARLLQRLVLFAQQASPLWRDWLAGVDGARLDAAAMQSLPVMERTKFRELAEAGGALPVPREHGSVSPHSTSGSTGQPVAFHVSQFSLRLVRHHYMADARRHGRNQMLRRAALGSRTDPHPGREHVFAQGNPWLGDSHLYTRRNLDFSMKEHALWLARLAPAYLATNPTVLSGILEAYEAGVQPAAGLQQVMTFGATVEPALRGRARRILGASIRDRYSCEEVGPIALQCPNDDSDEPGYHVCVANAVVEVVDDAGLPCAEGQTGRVLVTGLHHWASPAIRYDIGDVASLSPRCRCGAQTPTLFKLLGRKRALLRTPSGQSKFVRLGASDWLDVAPVREFRLVQQTRDTIQVELVLDGLLTDGRRAGIAAMLCQRVSDEFTWDIRQVSAIDWPPGAKRQDVVCLV
ncbi:MAG: AMP-binding protein [Pseudomonadota bacterium]